MKRMQFGMLFYVSSVYNNQKYITFDYKLRNIEAYYYFKNFHIP